MGETRIVSPRDTVPAYAAPLSAPGVNRPRGTRLALATERPAMRPDEREEVMRREWMMAAAVLLAAAIAAPAWAEETVCRGSLGAVTVDNLRVPDGARCTLTGTFAQGTVKVERGAVLIARRIRVIGNVQAENARKVQVLRSRIGGSVQLKQGGAAEVNGSRINADLQFESNRSPLGAASNVIGGNLQAFQNTGGISIRSNHIDGNLQCKENSPPPTGGGNVVQGNKEDQCRRL